MKTVITALIIIVILYFYFKNAKAIKEREEFDLKQKQRDEQAKNILSLIDKENSKKEDVIKLKVIGLINKIKGLDTDSLVEKIERKKDKKFKKNRTSLLKFIKDGETLVISIHETIDYERENILIYFFIRIELYKEVKNHKLVISDDPLKFQKFMKTDNNLIFENIKKQTALFRKALKTQEKQIMEKRLL